MTLIPHLSLPLRFVRGRAVVVEQDSPQHVADCVEAAARTDVGWRVEAPEFGIPSDLMHSGGVDVEELRAALVESEPRAAVVAGRVGTPQDVRAERIRILIEEGD